MGEEAALNSTNSQQAERDEQRAQANRDELVERINRAIREEGTVEPLPGIRLYRYSSPTEMGPGIADPALAVIAQGSKELYLGEEHYRYDPYHYCLGTVELPVTSRVTEASKARPYLCFRLALDPTLVGAVMTETGHTAPPSDADAKALIVTTIDATLLDAVVRLVRLIDTPSEAPILSPLISEKLSTGC